MLFRFILFYFYLSSHLQIFQNHVFKTRFDELIVNFGISRLFCELMLLIFHGWCNDTQSRETEKHTMCIIYLPWRLPVCGWQILFTLQEDRILVDRTSPRMFMRCQHWHQSDPCRELKISVIISLPSLFYMWKASFSIIQYNNL